MRFLLPQKNLEGIKINIFERLIFLAKGGKKSYQHTKGKENKNTTKLQGFLDEIVQRNGFK